MLTAEQIELRKTGVGSSDIGAVAGLSPYASPLDVWLQNRERYLKADLTKTIETSGLFFCQKIKVPSKHPIRC